jgi:hypothetical protein
VWKRLIATAVAAGWAIVTLSLNAGTALADGNRLKGTFTLLDEVGGSKNDCYGTSGYEDIQPGVQVVVRSGSNKILGKGRLGRGVGVSAGSSQYPMICVFRFNVGGLTDSKFYAIEVGHRGELTYSRRELDKKHWKVVFSLEGSPS